MGLIELMVAIVIALFVLAGLSGVFINMKLSNTGQDSLNQSQDSERVALNLLRTVVQQGGYYQAFSAGSFATAASAFAGGTNPVSTAYPLLPGQWISGSTQSTLGGSGHSLVVRYVGDSPSGIMNCAGQTIASGGATVMWTNTFALDTNNNLTCTVNSLTTGASATQTQGPYVLISNVSNMTILYGVDTLKGQAQDPGGPTQYMTAADINAANAANGSTSSANTTNLWYDVYTVRISLTFINPLTNGAGGGGNLPTVDETIFLMASSS